MNVLVLLLSLFTVVEWNVENLFDCVRDSVHDDTEWQSTSFRHWTHYRYWQKLTHVSQALLACGEHADGWMLPDVVILTEVESDTTMIDLTRRSELRSARYEYLMTDSRDRRGIDVAILYSPATFRPICYDTLCVAPVQGMRSTRDVLYLSGETISGDTLHLFGIHAPSRYGGERQTRAHRLAVIDRLLTAVDSIRRENAAAEILITGDFNDYDSSPSLQRLAACGLVNVSAAAQGRYGARGSYKYRGEWNSLDHMVCSPPLAALLSDCTIADFPFLLTDDERYGGQQPHRNFIGGRWQNGYSDHLPLVARFNF